MLRLWQIIEKNKPSQLKIKKKTLGQNASQSQCLVLHIPFILYNYKNKLSDVWVCVETLLQIITIVTSHKIERDDIDRLEELIKLHVTSFQQFFNKVLKPKHHFLTHYPTIILRIGPIISICTKRMEAKHQYFKEIINRTKDFINLKKTLAIKHQEYFCLEGMHLYDNVNIAERKLPFESCNEFEVFSNIIDKNIFTNENISKSSLVKFVEINDRKYTQGVMVFHDKKFFQIDYILTLDNSIYFLCSVSYNVKCYDRFLNAIELSQNEDHLLYKP